MANDVVIRKVMAAITDENLSMRSWITDYGDRITACFMGRAVLVMGVPVHWSSAVEWGDDDMPVEIQTVHTTSVGRTVLGVGAELCGLTPEQARKIAHNDAKTKAELWDVVTEVTGVSPE